MIDTHAHLNFKAFVEDRKEVTKRCWDKGLTKIINIGSQLSTSQQAVDLSDGQRLFSAVGIHPIHWDMAQAGEMKKIANLATQPGVVAIGETGLDYFHKNDQPSKKAQAKLFREHIDLAQKMDLPVVFHCRDAYEDLHHLLLLSRQERGVMHCFGGDKKWAKKFLDIGLYIGFTGIITFKNFYNDEMVRYAPLDRILIETDCPYLAPEPYRGERSEPWHIQFVAQKIARVKEIGYGKIIKETTKNAHNLFFKRRRK